MTQGATGGLGIRGQRRIEPLDPQGPTDSLVCFFFKGEETEEATNSPELAQSYCER